MSLDLLSPPELPPLPESRRATLRAHVLAELATRPGRGGVRRARVALGVALVALAVGGGTAVGIGTDFFAGLDRADERWVPPEMARVGPRAELARGPDWAAAAWRSAKGICVAYVSGDANNWGAGCGPRPEEADGDPLTPDTLSTFIMTPGRSADGRGAIVGAVTGAVARVELELRDGRVLRAETQRAPALETDARFFVVRAPLEIERPPGAGPRSTPVRTYLAYDAEGKLVERFPIGER